MSDAPAPGAGNPTNTPAATPTLPVTDRQTREQAFATLRRAQFDSDYRAAALRGDKQVQAEIQAAQVAARTSTHMEVCGVSVKLPGGEQPEARARELGSLQKFAYLPESTIGHWQRGEPCTAELQTWAKNFKARLFQDKSWTSKYLDGGQIENSQLAELLEILNSPTK